MADEEQFRIIQQGSVRWNQWRKDNPHLTKVDLTMAILYGFRQLGGTNFSGADLTGAQLGETYLLGADLTEANLAGANLFDAFLRKADLTGANLTGAILIKTNLNKANLRGANLTGANLWETNLIKADLTGADLTGAKVLDTVFGNTKLTDARGLEACEHLGPSIIDHATIVRSGQLPTPFLRGCGLPDTLIDYLPSLLGQAIQFSSCFISHSTEDHEFATRLHADLQNKGVRCWFSPHDAQGGKYLYDQIEEAIQVYDRLLLILSEASMQSEWVKTEIFQARKREIQENRRVLFPVSLVPYKTVEQWECFDSDIGQDLAREIRRYYVRDFSNCRNHDLYQAEFEKLLRDLKSEAAPQSQQ